jgi:hypothetical protein
MTGTINGGLMHPYQLIPWIGSLALEILLVFAAIRNNIHRRFPVFFAYIAFDITRAIALPAILYATPRTYNYFYAYWISVPIEYTLTFLIILEVFGYIFRAHITHSKRVIKVFALFALILFLFSLFLIIHPEIPMRQLTGIILVVNRSISLLMAGLLFFMWAYSSRIGFTMRDHVWGIVFGLGLYSSVSLIAAAIHAATGTLCPGWITPLPHYMYFGSTAIWNAYLWKKEPELPPLTDEDFSQYQNLVSTYRTLLKNVRKALYDDSARVTSR